MSPTDLSLKTNRENLDLQKKRIGDGPRTRIPIKNLYDMSPVSRSQAKQLSNQFESFSEVILDFEGVEWMGQGFAHELFVVFANAHPEIHLRTENMEDGVAKMYRHVHGR